MLAYLVTVRVSKLVRVSSKHPLVVLSLAVDLQFGKQFAVLEKQQDHRRRRSIEKAEQLYARLLLNSTLNCIRLPANGRRSLSKWHKVSPLALLRPLTMCRRLARPHLCRLVESSCKQ